MVVVETDAQRPQLVAFEKHSLSGTTMTSNTLEGRSGRTGHLVLLLRATLKTDTITREHHVHYRAEHLSILHGVAIPWRFLASNGE